MWLANYYAALALTRRELTRMIRVWSQTLLPSPINIGLYMLIFGTVMGGHIGTMGGVPYLEFLLPGLLMMGVANNAYSNVSSSFFLSKYSSSVEEMLVSPMSPWAILFGYLIGGILRGCLVFGLILAVAFCFITPTIAHPALLALAMGGTAFILSCAGFINGIMAEKFDDIAFIPTFVLTPLTYMGGIFYTLDMVPPAAQLLSHWNPMFYLVSAFRYAMLGFSDLPPMNILLVLGGIGLAVFSLAATLIHRGTGLKS